MQTNFSRALCWCLFFVEGLFVSAFVWPTVPAVSAMLPMYGSPEPSLHSTSRTAPGIHPLGLAAGLALVILAFWPQSPPAPPQFMSAHPLLTSQRGHGRPAPVRGCRGRRDAGAVSRPLPPPSPARRASGGDPATDRARAATSSPPIAAVFGAVVVVATMTLSAAAQLWRRVWSADRPRPLRDHWVMAGSAGHPPFRARPSWARRVARRGTAVRASPADAELFAALQARREQLDAEFFAALRARREELDAAREALARRWRTGSAAIRVGFESEDRVRCLALDWPLVALGSADGGVFVADIATRALVARSPVGDGHPRVVEGQAAEMELLHGGYDAGGVTAIAFDGRRLASGGRDAVARAWEYTPGRAVLAPVGRMPCGGVVTAVVLGADGGVWTAGLDGVVRRWAPAAPGGASDAFECELALDVGCPVLCLAVHDGAAVVACGDAAGGAHAFAIADGAPRGAWRPHAGARTRSIAVANGHVVTGGSDGRIVRQPLVLRPDDGVCVGLDARGRDELTPPHAGAVVALAAHPRDPALLVSGGQTGALRVWDLAAGAGATPKRTCDLPGYKVWLGSVAIDKSGRRLVSDGNGNAVLFRDFTPAEERDL